MRRLKEKIGEQKHSLHVVLIAYLQKGTVKHSVLHKSCKARFHPKGFCRTGDTLSEQIHSRKIAKGQECNPHSVSQQQRRQRMLQREFLLNIQPRRIHPDQDTNQHPSLKKMDNCIVRHKANRQLMQLKVCGKADLTCVICDKKVLTPKVEVNNKCKLIPSEVCGS